MADISLTASMRTTLLSLQNTQSLMDMTQERLSTGKKVNSAIDNPMSYYTAQGLTNRASDLEALLDSMGQGIQTLKAANEGIEAITSFVQQAKAVANTARHIQLCLGKRDGNILKEHQPYAEAKYQRRSRYFYPEPHGTVLLFGRSEYHTAFLLTARRNAWPPTYLKHTTNRR